MSKVTFQDWNESCILNTTIMAKMMICRYIYLKKNNLTLCEMLLQIKMWKFHGLSRALIISYYTKPSEFYCTSSDVIKHNEI